MKCPWGRFHSQNIVEDNVDIAIIEDGNVDSCVPWARVSGREYPRLPLLGSGAWSQARVNLSVSADALYLTARGALASGNLYVSVSHEGSDVSIRVFVHHRDGESLSRASVCRLGRDSGQIGVGIFVRCLYTIISWILTFSYADST